MICKIHKNLTVRVTLQNLACSNSIQTCSIAFEHSQEVLWCDVLTAVVDLHASIHILPIRSIENLPRERVLYVIRNVVIGEEDDLFFRDAILLHDLVRMERVCLMSVVAIRV